MYPTLDFVERLPEFFDQKDLVHEVGGVGAQDVDPLNLPFVILEFGAKNKKEAGVWVPSFERSGWM